METTPVILIGPVLTITTACLMAIAKWLFDLKAVAKRIEANQNGMSKTIAGHSSSIAFLRERTAGLESVVFHRPPILEEDIRE